MFSSSYHVIHVNSHSRVDTCIVTTQTIDNNATTAKLAHCSNTTSKRQNSTIAKPITIFHPPKTQHKISILYWKSINLLFSLQTMFLHFFPPLTWNMSHFLWSINKFEKIDPTWKPSIKLENLIYLFFLAGVQITLAFDLIRKEISLKVAASVSLG